MKEGMILIDSLNFPSQLSSLPLVESMIEQSCHKAGFDDEQYGNVLIAVTEAINNAVIHGNKQDQSKTVSYQFCKSLNGYCFIIKDEGHGFDYNNLPDPTHPDNIEKEYGRGVYLMRHLADDVLYNDKGNEVEIYFQGI
ncbi:MAG TPA: ATP-binding protein [Fluviicola sp.]|nr:ATP-binding protein [Fluviicola sp.]